MSAPKTDNCPFCDGDKHMVLPPNCTKTGDYNPGDNAQPIVRCMKCYAETMGSPWDYTKESAVTAWNTRPDPQPAADTRVTDAVLREAIGRAWCHEENVAKEMDVDLAEAVLWEIHAIIGTATPAPSDKMLVFAAQTFCNRVEAGEIRSKRSYAMFKDALNQMGVK